MQRQLSRYSYLTEGKDEKFVECKFTDLVQGLGEYYQDRKKMADISVAFCFICLLHLANEKGLDIKMEEKADRMDNLMVCIPN